MLDMKSIVKKLLPLVLLVCVVAACGAAVGCKSSEKTMYERKASNRGTTVKSNVKVKGSNATNGHTTRSY